MAHSDVLIVGGGVIGLTTAYYLASEGARVHVLDRSAPGREASWAGAGIIPPGNPEGTMHDYDRLRAISSRMYPALSASLREETGIDNGYHVCGGIELLTADADQTLAVWRREGIVVDEYASQEKELRIPEGQTYVLPEMAQVRNPWHLRALEAACVKRGVTITPHEGVHSFDIVNDRIVAIRTEQGNHLSADRYLIAAGAWSGLLSQTLSFTLPVRPILGQMLLFKTSPSILRRIVCFERAYLVPRKDGHILVGSTEEPEAGFEKRTTEPALRELASFARQLVPALANAEIVQSWSGLRPGTPDGLPFIGPVPGLANAFVAAGHYRAGIQLSPGTGQVVTDLLLGRVPSCPLTAFRLDRPTSSPFQPAFRS